MKGGFGYLLAGLLLIATAGMVEAASGGPDGYGYTFKDSAEATGPEYSWVDISTTGSPVINSGNNVSSNAAAPVGIGQPVDLGFPITLYGETVTQLVPSVDGYLSVNPVEDGSDNTRDSQLPTPPSDGKGGRIYVNHKNWQLAPGGKVYYQYFKQSPHPNARCGVSVFTWEGMRLSGVNSGPTQRFQVLIFDIGDILVQIPNTTSAQFGDDETIGIQDGKAEVGIAYGLRNPVTTSFDVAVRFELIATGGGATLQDAVDNAPAGAKLVGGGGTGRTVTISKPLAFVGTTVSDLVSGDLVYGAVFDDCKITVENGAVLTIADAVIKNSEAAGVTVRAGGLFQLSDSSIFGSGTNGVVVEQGGEFVMRLSEITNPAPGSGSHLVLSKSTRASIYKSLISESYGAGIEQLSNADLSRPSLEIELSSIVRNRGQGILAEGQRTDVIQTNISDNLGTGIIQGGGDLNLYSSNVTGNSSGGVTVTSGGDLVINHTVVAKNRSAVTGGLLNFNVGNAGSRLSTGSNLADTSETFLSTASDINGADPKLTPLGGYGEPIGAANPRRSSPLMCQLPLHGSPLIDASGSQPQVNTTGQDLRNRPRLVNGDNTGSTLLDIGAVEASPFVTVNTAADENNGGSTISLREALLRTAGERIVFAAGLNGATINLTTTAGGQGRGLGAANVFNFIDASSLSAGITISGGNTLNQPLLREGILAHGLTLSGGRHSAVRNFTGVLVLSDCRIIGNTQANSPIIQRYALEGGGVFNGNIAFLTNCVFEGNNTVDVSPGRCSGGAFASFPSAGTGLIVGVGVNYLVGCRFEGNSSQQNSGAISIGGGRKTVIDRCTFIGNSATGNYGGGLLGAVQGDGAYLDITRSSFVNNGTSAGSVGGILITGASVENPQDEILEEVSLSYCTFSGNFSGNSDGALAMGGARVSMNHCTITDNLAQTRGGITVASTARLEMRNTILDGNVSTADPSTGGPLFNSSDLTVDPGGIFVSHGNNLSGASITLFDQSSDLTLSPPLLAPLTQSLIAAPTRHPLHGSPAIDGGSGTGFAIDGRGFPGRQGPKVDIGAVESGLPVTVTTTTDEFNTPSGANVSLREALRDAREGSRVIFSASLGSSATIDLRTTASGQGTPLATSKNLVVDATMLPNGVTIRGGTALRCMTFADGTEGFSQSFSAHGVSFWEGKGSINGGAIYKGLRTDLSITQSAIYDCLTGNDAGAVHANGGSLFLENVTLANNISDKGGSAISGENGARIILRHSTVYNNAITTTNFPGGAAVFLEDDSSLETNHTALGNNFNSVTFAVRNVLSLGPNTTIGTVYKTQTDDATLTGAVQVATLNLGTLQPAGGIAQTCPPLAGSPVVNGGDTFFINNPSTDARGVIRKYGSAVDIGSHELGGFIPGTNSPIADFDNDLMDDYWEDFYGLNPFTNTDTIANTDGDAFTAIQEYRNQTNPNAFDAGGAPAPQPRMRDIGYSAATGDVTITFESAPGAMYSVRHSPDLSTAFSRILDVNAAASGSETTVIVSASLFTPVDGKAFFLIETR